jgi:anti-anti-sigma factor
VKLRVMQEALPGDVYRIAPQGRLDSNTIAAFEQVIGVHVEQGHMQLVIDMLGVTYVSSSGLRVLIATQRRTRIAGGDVVLCNMPPRIREIFEIVGFLGLFVVRASLAEAQQVFRSGVGAT